MQLLTVLLVGDNRLSGIIPPSVFASSVVALSVRNNNFTGALPISFGSRSLMLDLQNNQYISGALPKSMLFGTVATCSTGVSCASTMGRGPLLSIVCVPKSDMDRISQATVSAVEIATLFSSFPYDCAATTTTQ
jgi:hypothetical protein